MASYKHYQKKSEQILENKINVLDLIKKSKIEGKKNKLNLVIVTTIAISTLALSGILISQ